MHFSDDDLRDALKRKDPGEGFTQRVLARVEQAKARVEAGREPARKSVALPPWWMRRPAWALAMVALLLLGFAWGGYKYSEHQHEQTARKQQQQLEEARRQQEEAEHARDQAILALRIARSKLNHVLEQAQIPVAVDPIRRQRL
jgi:cytochrome c-type biogenesis protein CcmH/NrfG